ncbi:MAG TPA: hypothetical protein VGK70_14790, partial [Thermoanaerobaculia bacterium]
KLFELPRGREFIYARWNGAGDRIFAVTRDWQLVTLDSAKGTLLQQETLPSGGATSQDRLTAAALDAEATTQAYSVTRASSSLYLATGMR